MPNESPSSSSFAMAVATIAPHSTPHSRMLSLETSVFFLRKKLTKSLRGSISPFLLASIFFESQLRLLSRDFSECARISSKEPEDASF